MPGGAQVIHVAESEKDVFIAVIDLCGASREVPTSGTAEVWSIRYRRATPTHSAIRK